MSLRLRLLLAVGTVAVIALVVADVVTYSSQRAFLIDRVDRSLLLTLEPHGPGGPPVTGLGGGSRPTGPSGSIPPGGPGGIGGPALAAVGGTFVEIRDSSGSVLYRSPADEPGDRQYTPALPAHLPEPAAAGATAYLTTPSTVAGGPSFRVQVSQTTAGGAVILGVPLDTVDATLHQLLVVEMAVTLGALAAAIGLGWWLVRVGLRPLARIEETAMAISGGELGRRVPGDGDRTEVGRLARALNVMLARIQQAFAERDAVESDLRASEQRMRQFVADASHELRTPLAAVAAYAELFERGASTRPSDLERVMAGIRSESVRMGTLVEDLLLLARLDEGRPLERLPVELVSLAAEARSAALAVSAQWPMALDAAQPVEVVGDRLRLRQVLDNLLANVRAHTPPGTAATIRIFTDGDHAVLEVRDDGPGMPPEYRAVAFERFTRADQARSRDAGGSGLGLSIVAAIVSSAGGTVSVGGEDRGGTVVTVRLPSAPGPEVP